VTRVLFAADLLLPARGGAERFALELLGALAERGNDVRALWLAEGVGEVEAPAAARGSAGRDRAGSEGGAAIARLPAGVSGRGCRAPMAGGYWADKAARRDAVAQAVAEEVAREPPDVVVTQQHAAPGAIAAAGVPPVLLLPGYESLCRYAFEAGSSCDAFRDCVRCPRARALPDAEGARLRAERTAQEQALATATVLLAPSAAAAAACEAWCGRRPEVVPFVAAAPPPARARPGGHVLLAAARWSPDKGVDLVAPLAAALADRDLVVTSAGLDAEARHAIGTAGNVWFMDAPMDRLLDGSAVCLVPSRWPEPFGRIAFEAQAAGVPVLASAAGGLVEHVPEPALLPAGAGVEDWASAVRDLEDTEAWRTAHRAALAAAAELLALRPLERAAEAVERASADG
jgi:glycosyltransferase involved in cell wall biosynthesis